jgi:hypothetical protein
MAKKVQVLSFKTDALGDNTDVLEETQETLRTLRSLGVRFSTEIEDGADTTVSAWLEEKEPRQPKVRQALGSTSVPTDPPHDAAAAARSQEPR